MGETRAQGTAERVECEGVYFSVGHMQASFLVKYFNMHPRALLTHLICQLKTNSLKGTKHAHLL